MFYHLLAPLGVLTLFMGAFLIFAKEFHYPPDLSASARRADIVRVDEVVYDIGYTGLHELKLKCESFGIPYDCWPDYIDVDGDARRISLDDVEERNVRLRKLLGRLDDATVASDYYLKAMRSELDAGRKLFISH